MSEKSMGSKLIKILGILVLVAAVVGVGFLIFGGGGKVVDNGAATKSIEITSSSNYKSFDSNIKSDYNSTATSDLTNYVESIKGTDLTLYTNFNNAHLSYMSQWSIVNSLINDTAFGAKKGDIDAVKNGLEAYQQNLKNTLSAINVFNQDMQNGASDVTLKAEVKTIISRLNTQNNQLLSVNEKLVNSAIDSLGGYQNITNDLKVVLNNYLYYQTQNFQRAVSKIITEADTTPIQNQTDDVKTALKASLLALNNNYVYADINNLTTISVEDFLTTYKGANKVADFVKAADKTKFLSEVKDEEQKAKLNTVWQFVKELM